MRFQVQIIMMKVILSFVFILGLISCKPLTKLPDYLGETYPDSVPVIFAPGVVSVKGRLEHGISFAPNTEELAFGILSKDESGKIYYAKKLNENWTEPVVFEPLKDKSVFLPYFSPDGKSLLYAQSKPDTDNTYVTDIWMIEKMNDNWSSPKKIQAPISSMSREANASMTYDGTIYFSSNRNCDGKQNCFTADLFCSKLINTEYRSVEAISEFVSPNDEESVFISPREEYIIFCRYTNNETLMDLYISYRDHDNNWTEPQILDSTINSKEGDRRPFVTIDNKFLFFTRLQIEEKGLTESDIFWVNTSKVFKPFVYKPLPDTVVQLGDKFEFEVPEDYFKDIDDNQVALSINQAEFSWLMFDSKSMKISGLPILSGDFELTFTAVDKHLNTTEDKIIITVMK